jgi:signal transduction histidine kinase
VKTYESPFLADWFAITLRWIILFGLTLSFALSGPLSYLIIVALVIPIIWNVFMSVMAVFNRRFVRHRMINVLFDCLSVVLLFAAGNQSANPILWAGLIAIAPAAIYYQLSGSLLVAVLVTAIETGLSAVLSPAGFDPIKLTILSGLNITGGLIVGILSQPLIQRLRANYTALLRQRQESEARVQHAERDRMKALFGMIETVSATLNYKTILETSLDFGNNALGLSREEADKITCAFFLFDDALLRFSVGKGFTSHDQSTTLPAQQGVLSEIFHTGAYRLLQSTRDDPELSGLISLQDTRSILCLPMIRGMNAYGVLIYAHPTDIFFTSDRIEQLAMITNQAVVAIQNARLFQDLASEKARIVQTQEEAQKKLARELHDGPTQSVSAIAMRISIARKMMERDPAEAIRELVKIEDLARRTTQEIRHMLFTLRPLVLESEGLIAALNSMATKLHDLYQQNVVIDVDPAVVEALDVTHQTVVFYLTEEAVNNARKHAGAAQIKVMLKFITREQNMAGLEIADNGKGFDVKEVMDSYNQRGSLGMVNLRERTDLINGLLKLDSIPGKGTRIRIFIPLTEEAVDQLHSKR